MTFIDLTNTTLYRTCRFNQWVKFVEWTRPISYTQKKDKEGLKIESPENVVVPQRNIIEML